MAAQESWVMERSLEEPGAITKGPEEILEGDGYLYYLIVVMI